MTRRTILAGAAAAALAAALFGGVYFLSGPGSAARHERKGDGFLSSGKVREAYVEYRNAVAKAPGNGRIQWKLARAAALAGDLAKAYEETKKAVEISPENLDALARLGEFHLAAGETEQARKISEALALRAPTHPRGYVLRAGLAMKDGRHGEVVGFFEKALEADPGDYRAAITAGGYLALRNDPEGAARWYDRALTIAPREPSVHVAKGNFLFSLGDVAGGEAEYRKAIDLAPDRESVRIGLADHLYQRGRVREAEGELDSLARETGSLKAKKRLAEMALRLGKVDKAREVVAGIRKDAPRDVDGMLMEARLLLNDGKTDRAMGLLSEVLRMDASSSRARQYMGIAEAAVGNTDVARRDLREAVRLDPSNHDARTSLASLLLQAGAPAEAERESLEALRADPGSIPAALIYADSFVARKQYAAGERVFEAMIRQMPDNPLGYYRMGMSRNLQGKRTEGRDYLRKAHERGGGTWPSPPSTPAPWPPRGRRKRGTRSCAPPWRSSRRTTWRGNSWDATDSPPARRGRGRRTCAGPSRSPPAGLPPTRPSAPTSSPGRGSPRRRKPCARVWRTGAIRRFASSWP